MEMKIVAIQSQQQEMSAQIEGLQSNMNAVKSQLQTIHDLLVQKEQIKTPPPLQRMEPDGKRVFELPEGSPGVCNWQKISYKSRLTQVLGKKTWTFISNLALSGQFDDPAKTYRDIARDILKYALKQREDLEYKISEFRESVQFTLPQTARLLEEKLIEVLKKKKYESKKREKTDPSRRATEAIVAELKENAELHPILPVTPIDIPRLNVLAEPFLTHPILLEDPHDLNQRKRKSLDTNTTLDVLKKARQVR